MFQCLICHKFSGLPRCEHCGSIYETNNGIYQLTKDPNINLDDTKGAKYLGYDRVGSYYGEREWINCSATNMLIGGKMAELTHCGMLLDLGCGYGTYSVPAALHGCTVIAGDISGVMLELLLQKMAAHRVDPGLIIPCRMNALSIPLAADCVDGAMVNSVLHLISEPNKVITELGRVLKLGAKLMFLGNSPGLQDNTNGELQELNKDYMFRLGQFHRRYWEIVKGEGVCPTRYSWKFDQVAKCEDVFGNHTQIELGHAEQVTERLSDYFLYRMAGKGYSDQQGVPDDLHERAFAQVMNEFRGEYGPDFDSITRVSIRNGAVLHVFEKSEATNTEPVELCV